MKVLGFLIGRLGFYFYAQGLWKYRQFYLSPALSVESVVGNHFYKYFDIEMKFLCFAVGLRFLVVKNQKILLTLYSINT